MGISWNLADASRQLLPMLEGFLTPGLGPRLHTLEGGVPHWVWDRDWREYRSAAFSEECNGS